MQKTMLVHILQSLHIDHTAKISFNKTILMVWSLDSNRKKKQKLMMYYIIKRDQEWKTETKLWESLKMIACNVITNKDNEC